MNIKIAISTIVDYNNYGNRLQNYALQIMLEKKGYEVTTIKNYYIKKSSFYSRVIKLLQSKQIMDKVINKIFITEKSKLDKIRSDKFINFTKTYINETNESFTGDMLSLDFLNQFDCFIIGSDQVWNYNFPRFSNFDFINFTDKPKISYAASFGVSEIPEELHAQYSTGLSMIDCISVREFAGKEIVEKLTDGKECQVVLDPTLMLSKDDWYLLIEGKEKYTQKFLLTYFLDEPSKETWKYIEKIAAIHGFFIKKLGDRQMAELWVSDPSDFVNLFSQAEYVFTDSFHACVFSIIFEKNFEVFERNTSLPSMNSRIDTLFSTLNLTDRWHSNSNNSTEEINYEIVNKLLKKSQQSSLEFLENSLKRYL